MAASITSHDSSTETLTYDDNGQLIQTEKSTGEITQYVWNSRGFLTKVILPTGEPVEYIYDGANRLIGRRSSEGEDIFTQSGWNIISESDKVGRKTLYTGLSSLKNDGSSLFFQGNHRGDTVLVTDEKGNSVHGLSYDAYGRIMGQEGLPINNLMLKDIPNLFVGTFGIRYDVKTDLHYMRNQWYSPEFMRFMSPDIMRPMNRYAYVENNPLIYIDPFGLDSVYIGIYKPPAPNLTDFITFISHQQGNTVDPIHYNPSIDDIASALQNYDIVIITGVT